MKARLAIFALAALGLLWLAVAVAGVSPAETVAGLWRGSLSSPRAITGTLRETAPLLLCGLAVFLALRAGLFNIGVEGQFLCGALAGAAVGLFVPSPMALPLALLAGGLGGAIWAAPAGLIRAYRGGHEVITTIMLNNVAALLTTAVVAGPLRDPDQQIPSTAALPAGAAVGPVLGVGGVEVPLSLVIGLLAVAAASVWLTRSVSGFELRLTGESPGAARYAGVDVRHATLGAMLGSGAIAGLAGALQVVAFEGRFYQGFSPGYGFDAIGVALLAGPSAWALVPSALLFGVLGKGTTALQLIGLPKGIGGVVVGLLILGFAAYRYRQRRAEGGA